MEKLLPLLMSFSHYSTLRGHIENKPLPPLTDQTEHFYWYKNTHLDHYRDKLPVPSCVIDGNLFLCFLLTDRQSITYRKVLVLEN